MCVIEINASRHELMMPTPTDAVREKLAAVGGAMTRAKAKARADEHDGCHEAMDGALYGIETLINNLRRFDHGDAITTAETDLEEAACKQRPRA